VSDCSRFESMVERLLASDLDPQALSDLRAHASGCDGCRRLLEIHGDLTEAGARAPEPDEADLDLVQERVWRNVKRRRVRRPLRVAALAAGLILPFAVGLILGRILPGRANGASSSRLMDALHAEAASNRGLTDVEDSPFTYSNVSYRRLGDDRVALDFDVTTHLATVESTRSPLVREVLAQSLLNPSSVGERLKAMSFAASWLEPKLEKAVLFALRNDENVAVRLAALTVLVGRLDDEEVRSALMAALRDDPSVQVRLAALESLTSHRVDPRLIREAIRVRPGSGNEALLVRLTELEREP
jgi:HEAT repeat protein